MGTDISHNLSFLSTDNNVETYMIETMFWTQKLIASQWSHSIKKWI